MVYFDPRGMGGSGPVREDGDMGMAAVRADFDALRRHLGLDRVSAIGWSNGAMNLILLAAENPRRSRRRCSSTARPTSTRRTCSATRSGSRY